MERLLGNSSATAKNGLTALETAKLLAIRERPPHCQPRSVQRAGDGVRPSVTAPKSAIMRTETKFTANLTPTASAEIGRLWSEEKAK